MNKFILFLGFCLTSSISNKANAQASFSMSVNIGAQPVWGPVGYDHVEYYYLPDIEAYYYVPRHQYVYLSGSSWVFAASLPLRYANYDIYNGYKVVVNEPRAYMHYREHRQQYAGFRGRHNQVIIRNSDEPRYYVVKGHPKYKADHGNGQGNGKEHGKGHEKHHD